MEKINAPEFTILSDYVEGAHDLEEVDLFSLQSHLGPIFDILRHKETIAPLAMALYGHAGSGKTTALRWLEHRVKLWNLMPEKERGGHPCVLPVWFRPHKYNASDCILQNLISEIILQVLPLLDYPDEASKTQQLVDVAAMCDGVLGSGFFHGLASLAQKWGLKKALVSETLVGKEVSPDFDLAAFYKLFTQWLQSFDGPESPFRIAVLVDSVDRCRASTIMEVIKVIGHHLRSPNILFVVAFDGVVARRLIQQEYQDHGYGEEESRCYLSKIFPVECRLESSPAQIRNFYAEQVALLNRKAGNLFGEYLDPTYKSDIDEAILRIAGNNLRKIKLLLNNALMSGDTARRKADEKDVQLRFTQSIQLYLIQCWLRSISIDGSVLFHEDVWNWFVAISEKAGSADSDFAWLEKQQKIQDEKGTGKPHSGRHPYVSPDALLTAKRLVPPEGLAFNMIQEWVWNLLKIPFGSGVEDFPVVLTETGPVSKAAVETVVEQEGFEEISTALKDALAAAVDVPVTELTSKAIHKLVSLNLSGVALEDKDYPFIGKMKALERLDLYNSGVDSLDWIRGLKHLKILSLSCTQVLDIAPLVGLTNLESIDLSYTQVGDLHPLAGLFKLKMLILYGTPVKSIRMLKGLKNLERLNLSQTQVTSEEIIHLQGMSSLKNLFLRETSVDLERIQRLKQVLGFNLDVQL